MRQNTGAHLATRLMLHSPAPVMNPQRIANMNIPLSILTDSLMAVLFVLLMADVHTGNPAHEWLGLLLTVSVMLHTWLNRTWYSTLQKGSYNAARMFRLLLNILLLFFLIGTLASAVPISRTIFTFAGGEGGLSGRTVHVFCAHWCFLLAAIHLGVYGRRLCATLKRHVAFTRSVRYARVASGLGIVAAACGAYAFYSRELIYPLTMRSAFMPWSENAALFLLDYCSIFFLFAWTCHVLLALVHAAKRHEPFFRQKTRQGKQGFQY